MTNTNVKQIWSAFVTKHDIVAAGVQLFAKDGLTVRTKKVGKTYVRNVLERSSAMEALIVTERDKLIDDWQQGTNRYDGLIYMIYRRSLDGEVIPLYIGKTETVGKRNNNLSVNIKGLKTDKSKFARWGDGHQYHIGDLSAAVLPNYPDNKIQPKYVNWADALFTDAMQLKPQLKVPVYFWAKAWSPSPHNKPRTLAP